MTKTRNELKRRGRPRYPPATPLSFTPIRVKSGKTIKTIASLPPHEASLTKREAERLLDLGHLLKRLGHAPDQLLEAEFLAEAICLFLQGTEDASVPDLLRVVVNDRLPAREIVVEPAMNSKAAPDALDAPLVRNELKRARSWYAVFGGWSNNPSAKSGLRACAAAVGLSRVRGAQPRPRFDLVKDDGVDFWMYTDLRERFASRIGISPPKFDVGYFPTAHVADFWANTDGRSTELRRRIESALSRQVAAYEGEGHKRQLRGRLSPAQRCALALWEIKKKRPVTEHDIDAAVKNLQRLQRNVRRLKVRIRTKRPRTPKT